MLTSATSMSSDRSLPLFRGNVRASDPLSSDGIDVRLPRVAFVIGAVVTALLMALLIGAAFIAVPSVISAKGSLASSNGLPVIAPPYTAYVKTVLVELNSAVTAGQAVANVVALTSESGARERAQTKKSLEETAQEVRAQLVSTENFYGLEKTRLESRLRGAQDELALGSRQTELLRKNAEIIAKRLDRLADASLQGIVPIDDIDQMRERLVMAEMQAQSAEKARQTATWSVRENQAALAQLEFSKSNALSELRRVEAETQLRISERKSQSEKVLVANVNGTVVDILANPGDVVPAEQAFMVIRPRSSQIQAVLSVPLGKIGQVRIGQTCVINMADYRGRKLRGRVVFVPGAFVESKSRKAQDSDTTTPPVGQVRVSFDTDISGSDARPGTMVTGSIYVDRKPFLRQLLDRVDEPQR